MATFLEQTFGGGGQAAPGVTLTPQQNLDNMMLLYNSPIGQDYQQSVQDTNALNVRQILAQIENARKQLELQKGTQEANRWAQEQQYKLAQQAHQLNARQFETNATGYLDGNPTLNRQQFEAGTTGYYNGAPTLQREQLASSTALQAAGLGAQLKGPRNYPFYLEAMNTVANSPASNLVRSAPGGLGAAMPGFTPQRQTLAGVLSDAGLSGGGQGAASGGVTNQSLGLTDSDAATLRGYFMNPNSAPGGWLESKSQPERESLAGLADFWGHDFDTITNRYANSRVRQGDPRAA